jgi:hypothetical protein
MPLKDDQITAIMNRLNQAGRLILLPAAFLMLSFARPDKEFMVFQFPRDQIPRIDGDFSDWAMVPDSFIIGTDQLENTVFGVGKDQDPADYDLKVKAGWVKGLNRLYFYLEAYDDYWDFSDPALKQDIFELVVDADISGGPFINTENKNIERVPKYDLYYKGHGGHAQNYHIFTPVKDKVWAMIWGNAYWIRDFPHAHAVYEHDIKPGEDGLLRMEFWITPFDFASHEGFERSIVSDLKEDHLIGLSWSILDWDGGEKCDEFRNLAHDIRMINDASYLCAFRLMPLLPEYRTGIQADWTFHMADRDERIVHFIDRSEGQVTGWHWDFGDGFTSTEQHPVHQYGREGDWTVILTVEGSGGKSSMSKVWDVVTK